MKGRVCAGMDFGKKDLIFSQGRERTREVWSEVLGRLVSLGWKHFESCQGPKGWSLYYY